MKPQTFKEILKDKIEKLNPWHDPATGRFVSGGGGGASFSANPNTVAGQRAIERASEKNPTVGLFYQQEKWMAEDKAAIGPNIEKVRKVASNKVNSIGREAVDLDKVMKEGGCDLETAKKAATEAKNVYENLAKAEPQITSDIVDAVGANNGKMYGLDHRMKQETSLARKIAKDATDEYGGDLQKAAANIKDGCRYTAVFEVENFTDGYNNVKASLEAKGYKEERCKNFYEDYKNGDSQQKAVQCVFSDPNGNKLELQFHTYESQGAKEVNHPLYEEYRGASTGNVDKANLNLRMKDISANVPDPEGVYDIKAHK